MSIVDRSGQRKTVLVVAVATALGLGGCSVMNSELAIRPVQRSTGLVERTVVQDPYAEGRAHFQSGRYGLALQAFEKGLAQHPRSVDLLNGMGAVYDKLGRYDLSVSYYYRALQIAPDSAKSLGNLGYSFILQGKPEAARNILRMAEALDPDNPVIAANLAMLPRDPAPSIAVAAPVPPVEPAVGTDQGAQSGGNEDAELLVGATPEAPVVFAANPPVIHDQIARTAIVVPEAPQAQVVPARQEVPVDKVVEIPASYAVTESISLKARGDGSASEKVVTDNQQEVIESVAAVSASPLQAATPEAPSQDGGVARQEVPVDKVVEIPASYAVTESISVEDRNDVVAGTIEITDSQAELNHSVAAVSAPPSTRSVERGHVQLSFDTLEGKVEVSNGNGYEGIATALSSYFEGLGQQVAHITNAAAFDHQRTVIYYREGKRATAEMMGASLPVPAIFQEVELSRTDVRVVLGQDIGFYQQAIERATGDEAGSMARLANREALGIGAIDLSLEVSNGNGRNGMAALLAGVLGRQGEKVVRITNDQSFANQDTRIFYTAGHEQEARLLAARLPVQARLLPVAAGTFRKGVGLRVVIGHDFLPYEGLMHDLLAAVARSDEHA